MGKVYDYVISFVYYSSNDEVYLHVIFVLQKDEKKENAFVFVCLVC